MDVSAVSNKQSFEGNIILKNKISVSQNHLFNLHRAAIEQKIKDLPFDIFVEQSKSKKTISLYANVEDANKYIVRKNKQDFEQIADYVIADGKKKSPLYQKMLRINEMFDYSKSVLLNIFTGKYNQARFAEKELANLGVKNFEDYKDIPKINIKNLPWPVFKQFAINSIKYRVYRAFSPKTSEEKTFAKMRKEYLKGLKAENKEIKTVELDFRKYMYGYV